MKWEMTIRSAIHKRDNGGSAKCVIVKRKALDIPTQEMRIHC